MAQASFSHLTDDELLNRLERVSFAERHIKAQRIAMLVEAEDRRIDLKNAYSSMFEFCTKHLKMSESSACRHLIVSRLVRSFPFILSDIESGDVNLSTLNRLRDYLTDENAAALIEMARGRSAYELTELLASIAPRPDVKPRMRKFPQHKTAPSMERAQRRPLEPLATDRWGVHFTADRTLRDQIEFGLDLMSHTNPDRDLVIFFIYCVAAGIERLESTRRGALKAPRERGLRSDLGDGPPRHRPSKRAASSKAQARPSASTASSASSAPSAPSASSAKGASAAKSASSAKSAKRAPESVPSSTPPSEPPPAPPPPPTTPSPSKPSVAKVMPGCAGASMSQAEARSRARARKRRAIPRATVRFVFQRDGHQCTFVSRCGKRCSSRRFLQLDHVDPHALDGCDEAWNLRVRCRAHNRYGAELTYGKDYIARAIARRRSQSRSPSQSQSSSRSPSPARSHAHSRARSRSA